MMNPQNLPADVRQKIISDRAVRRALATESHAYFFSIYLPHYLKYPSAPFHNELFTLTEDQTKQRIVIVAFRGSGKSTVMTLSYPIWAIIGKLQKKYVLVVSQTERQARQHLANIKLELERNERLRIELGPFEENDEWGLQTLVIPKHGARIMAASSEQSIRGIRHGANRPDLIICDDVEDLSSVKTREGRNKIFSWLTGEVIPAGDENTKVILVGNLLHEDSLMMRLKDKVESGELDWVYRQYPIIDTAGKPLWPGKYPDQAAIEVQRKQAGDERAWLREYLLKIVADVDQIIKPEWIKFYDQLPPKDKGHEYINSFFGVDVAISQKVSADCTAVVVIHVYGFKPENRRYYIDRRFINQRLTYFGGIDAISQLYHGLHGESDKLKVLVEDVGLQSAHVEGLEKQEVSAKAVKIRGDKYERLMAASMLFEQGRVLFPRDEKVKTIIQQLVGFGKEKHDDLVDAATLALNYIQRNVTYGIVFSWGWIGDGDSKIHHSYGIKYLDEEPWKSQQKRK